MMFRNIVWGVVASSTAKIHAENKRLNNARYE
jgi:hypothetical protein